MQIFKLKWSLKDFDQDNTFTRHNKLLYVIPWYLQMYGFSKKKIPIINTHETEKGQTWDSYWRLFKLMHYILKKNKEIC